MTSEELFDAVRNQPPGEVVAIDPAVHFTPTDPIRELSKLAICLAPTYPNGFTLRYGVAVLEVSAPATSPPHEPPAAAKRIDETKPDRDYGFPADMPQVVRERIAASPMYIPNNPLGRGLATAYDGKMWRYNGKEWTWIPYQVHSKPCPAPAPVVD